MTDAEFAERMAALAARLARMSEAARRVDRAWRLGAASRDPMNDPAPPLGLRFGRTISPGVAGREIATTPSGALKMLICAAGATFALNRLVGEVAGVFHVAGRALHNSPTDLAALEVQLAAMKAARV